MKKVAPPGRRAATRVKKFTVEEGDVQPIPNVALDEQGEEQPQTQHEEQSRESEELQHATNVSMQDASEQEQRQSSGSAEQSNGHEEELSEMPHSSSAVARTVEEHEDDGDDAEDEDDTEDEEAKAQALAMQQEAERLASQIKAEQECASLLVLHARMPSCVLQTHPYALHMAIS